MRKLLVLVVLMLSQTACSQEATSVLHIRYNEKVDFSKILEMAEDGCRALHEHDSSILPYKLDGDKALIGHAVKDVYWTQDGIYRTTYKKNFLPKRASERGPNICQFTVAPEVTIEYEDFRARKRHYYKRVYTRGKGPDTLNKWGYDALDVMDGAVETERWGVHDMKDISRIRTLSPVLGKMVGANEEGVNLLGEEDVAGFTCVKQQAKIFLNAGDDGYMCVWTLPGGNLPEIVLKGRAVHKSMGLTTIEAEKVDLNADVPPSILLPPAEWLNKPNGGYSKTAETNGRWFNEKEMKALKKANSKQSKSSKAGGE